MRVSLHTIRQFVGHDLPPVDELVDRINQQLGAVEQVIDLGEIYKDAKIVRVVECAKHPNADRLSVCKVDVGTDDLVQVVCGAPNVRAGIWAVWLPPESIVPSTSDDDEPFVLGARELRGVMSHGMLAAGDELAINNDHDGIVEVNETDLPEGKALSPGASFAGIFDLDDTVIDIENKMFTHRPDLFGQMGVAREIFAILQPEPSADAPTETRFTEREWYWNLPDFQPAEDSILNVFNDVPNKVPRLMFTVLNEIKITKSPLWLQTTLVRWGAKSINNVVDLTNYIMLLTAQPTHAYDYEKLRGHSVGARMASDDETVTLLNGKTYSLTSDDIVIADGEGPVGLAGIMGGLGSEVSEATKRVVLEVGTFDMYTVRKSSMRHGVFTDALTRFNKGQSPLQNDRVMHHLMSLMNDVAGSVQASQVYDLPGIVNGLDKTTLHGSQRLTAGFVNDRLGLALTPEYIGNLLRFANFAVYKPEGGAEDELEITAPFWRTDIELPEDIVEEVGRLYGFDKLPRELPVRTAQPVHKNSELITKRFVRRQLSRGGANEVLTYSFVHRRLLEQAGQNPSLAYSLANALSPDLQYYRLSVLPSLLDKVRVNVKAGYDAVALFETGKVHYKGEMDDTEPAVPNEDTHVAFVVAYADKHVLEGSAYFSARRYLEQIVDLTTLTLTPMEQFDLSSDERGRQLSAAYEPSRSALIVRDGLIWGVIGEFHAEVTRGFKLPRKTAGFEVHLDIVKPETRRYEPLSKFPSVSQDISIRVRDVPFERVEATVRSVASRQPTQLRVQVLPTVIYQPAGGDEVTTTFRLSVTSQDSTLTDDDVRKIVDEINMAVEQDFGGRII